MRRAKRITALAVAAAMVFSNVAYAAPGTTDTTTTQTGAESAESLNSQSDASGGTKGEASDQTGNGTDSSTQSGGQTETKNTDTSEKKTDAGGETKTQTTQGETTKKDDSSSTETTKTKESQTSQTQKTPTTDTEAQKSAKKQETSKTEQEPVLYDITFETPEKHGKVTDMDGNEVADGKTLKTDENGKAQFKVKADDGYQVSAVYQMPNEKAPLKLVEDSYYELQVDKNTTVKVVYQKIPEKSEDDEDAGSDKAEEPKEDVGEKTDKSDQHTTEKERPDEANQQTLDEEKTDETTEEVNMPEQILTTKASDGAVITITVPEGALPEGAKVNAKPVESVSIERAVEKVVDSEGKELQEYKAYDITIQDNDGNEIQPEKEIQVDISGTNVAGEEVNVFHIADGSEKAEKVSDEVSGDVATFSAESFSIYVIAGTNHGTGNGQTQESRYTMVVGETIQLQESNLDKAGTWSITTGNDVVQITDSSGGRLFVEPWAEIQALKDGTATVQYKEPGRHGNSSNFYITVEKAEYTITFNPNGGTGDEKSVTTEETNITLPSAEELGFSNGNKTFIGWSTDSNGRGDTFTSNVQYPDNANHDAKLTEDVTLYAIWLDTNATQNNRAYFYIRQDGAIAWEPAGYGTDQYYPTGSAKTLEGKLKQPIAINNNNAAVEANLAEKPTDNEIKAVLLSYGVSFDPSTQYIQWYVIKYRDRDTDGITLWNVDGVIRDKAKFSVQYNPNGGDTNVPLSVQYTAGENVIVDFSKTPSRAGYTFLGWARDQQATVPDYAVEDGNNQTFIMPEKNVTLYAVWQEKDSVRINYKAVGGGSVSPASESLNPETGIATGSTATANSGYKFVGWYDNEECSGDALSTELDFVPTKKAGELWVNGKTYYAKFEEKNGVAGYNLGGGTWINGIPNELEDNSNGESPKYPYKTNFEYEDTFTVIDDIPEKTGSVFLGWYQKPAEMNESKVVHAGDTVIYPYKNPNRYTLDALWASLTVNGTTVPYDRNKHSISDEITFNNSLPDEFKEQVEKLVSKGKTLYRYSKDNVTWSDWNEEKPTFIDAGSYTVQVKQEVTVDGESQELTGEGTVVITPIEITLRSESGSKPYDGTALTMPKVTVVSGAFVEGEGFAEGSPRATGSVLYAGESEKNTIEYELAEGTKAVNYNIQKEEGTLTITDRDDDKKLEITVTAKSDEQPYNGTEQKVEGFETLEFNVGGQVYKVEGLQAKAVGTDVKEGGYESKVTGTAVVRDAAGKDVTDQFKVKTENGKLTITPIEIKISTESGSKTYDGTALEAPGTIEGIVKGEDAGFKVIGSQTLVGVSKNTYVLTWVNAKESNYVVTENLGTLTVTDGSEEHPIDPEDVVKKTHGDEPGNGIYEAGEVVTFDVSVTNIYNEMKTITLQEIDGVTLERSVFEDVEPGETVRTTATYTITEKDILADKFVNTVTASFSGEKPTFEDDDIVDEIEDPEGHLLITKETTSNPGENGVYSLGDVITYKITATNDGNLTLTDVVVTDDLTGDEWTIETLKPGESKEFTAEYTVTEEDILAGTVVNTATAEGTSPDPDEPEVPVTPGEKEDPTDTKKPSLFVEKTAQPDEDGVYNLGDEIVYTVKVVNNGNVTVTNIDVADDLTGGAWTIDSLAPGESEEFTTTYTVTEDDILNGSITNVATAEGTDPKDDPVDTDGEETVPTDPADSRLTVNKKTTSNPGEDGTYGLGDTITYEIVVTNAGNLTLNNVVVTDKLTGDEWTIETLTPGASETMEASYVVTEEDIHNGSVINEATATADGKEEEDPEIIPGETEDKTDPENPDLSISKSVVEPKEEYQIGDTIQYQITVSNTGNVTQDDILVTDQLQAAGDIVIKDVDGAEGEIDGENVTLDSLAPGETATIDCEYTVLKEDRGNTITNVAVADDKDGEDPQTPEVPAEVTDVYDISVVHQFADGEEGDVELPNDYTVENIAVGTERTFTAESVDGYTAYPATQSVTVEDRDITVTFVYYKDEIGTDPENPDNPDNIPDKYQATVTYAVVNGTLDRTSAVVTLKDADGNPAEDGTGYLTEEQIAAATANDGYAQDSLTWAPEAPTTEVAITENMTFTATFEKRNDLHYEVHYFYDEEEAEDQAVVSDEGVFGEAIPYTSESPVEYNDHNYVLDRVDGEGKTISTNAAANIINVYYALDEKGVDPEDPDNPDNPDGTADKYQVAFTYVAGEHGSVDGTLAEVVTRPDNSTEAPVKAAAEVTATPDSGYHFVDWTTQDGQHFADVESIRAAEFDEDTVFTANFAEDGNVVINYAATEGGSVNPVNESLAPATGNAAGSTATAADGYRFVNWTDAEGNVVSTDAHFAPAKVNGLNVAATYTAHFERRTDLHYEVHYFYDGTEAEDQAVVNDNATFGAEIPYTDTASVTYNGQNYVLDRVDGEGKTVTTDADANVVNVYYTLDEVGTDPENPDNPDNVPDKYQVTVTFVAGDHGTVTGTTTEVITRTDADGNYSENAPVSVQADVTATPDTGYHITGWTASDGRTFADLDAVRTAQFDEDTVLTANFDINVYTVTVVDPDGDVITEIEVPHGGNVDLDEIEVPEIPGYEFDGFDHDGQNIQGDTVIHAEYTQVEEPEEPTTPTVPTLPTTPTTPGTPTTPTLPVTPANPGTPTTPALPGAPAAAGTTAPIVYADGVVVDDAEPAEDDYNLNEVERDGDTETIDEDATPLGNMDLDKDDDHKCCILHFILLLLALIVELIYTHDRKKRQERIFELRRELEDIDDEELQADR